MLKWKGEKPEPKLLTRAERELIEDSRLPPSDDDDDDLDGTEYYEKADDDEDEEEEGDEEAHVSPNGGGFPPDAPPAASPSQEATSAGFVRPDWTAGDGWTRDRATSQQGRWRWVCPRSFGKKVEGPANTSKDG